MTSSESPSLRIALLREDDVVGLAERHRVAFALGQAFGADRRADQFLGAVVRGSLRPCFSSSMRVAIEMVSTGSDMPDQSCP